MLPCPLIIMSRKYVFRFFGLDSVPTIFIQKAVPVEVELDVITNWFQILIENVTFGPQI